MKNILKKLAIAVTLSVMFVTSVAFADRTFNLPDQTGQNGKVLGTDGTNPSWILNGAGIGGTIGGAVVGGTPDWILYIDNAGNLIGDNDATRDSTTHDTLIGKDSGGFSNILLAGDPGFGFDAAAIIREANVGTLSATIAAIDGAILGRDASTVFIDHTDATGNIAGTIIMDSTDIFISHDDITSNTASVIFDANSGSFLTFNDGNSANTFSRFFYIDTTGMGWADGVVGYSFRLPQAVGVAGSVPTDVLGNGVLSMQPGGAITAGASVGGCGVKEVLYNSNVNTLACDPGFYRDSVTEDSAITNSIMQAGYTAGLVMDDVLLPNSLAFSYFDAVNVKGSFLLFRDTTLSNKLRDGSVAGFNPDAGMDVDFTVPTKFAKFYYQDNSTPNKSSEFRAQQNDLLMRHYYNLSGNLTNTWEVNDTGIESRSGFLGGGLGLNFDYSNYRWAFGDLPQTNNGLTFTLNDNSHAIDFGDPGGIEGGVVFALRNNSAGTRQIAFGSLSGTDGMRFTLDLNGRTITMGDQTGVVNGTVLEIDDPAASFEVRTNLTELMAHVSGVATDPVSFGWKALQSVSSGTGNSAFGNLALNVLTTGNDNTAIGNSAMATPVVASSNVAVGIGAMGAAINPSGSGLADNIAIGRDAGLNLDGTTGAGFASGNVLVGRDAGKALTTGSDNILLGEGSASSSNTGISRVAIGNSAIATANYQVMFGGINSPFSEIVFGGDIAQSGSSGHDVLIRTIKSQGTDKAGGDLQYQSGLGTGTGGSGEHQWFTAPAGATGTTLNTSTKTLSLDLNGNLRAYTLHNNATAQGSAANQDIRSGTYTPIRSAESNITGTVTMTGAQWFRVGNVVTVSGRFNADPTLTVTSTSFEITLPAASNIGATSDAAGVAFSGAIAGQGAEVTGVVANDTAQIQWISGDINAQDWSYTFTYEVI